MNLLDFVFPKVCLGCGREGAYICKNCLNRLPQLPSLCPICEKPSIDGVTHTRCLSPLALNGLISLWPYQGVVRRALIGLKYKFASEIAKEITVYLTAKLKHEPLLNFTDLILIPIPVHPLRKNWRGFNQAEIVGQSLAKYFGWRFCPDFLLRKKMTLPQTGLEGKERIENIRGVFTLNSSYKPLITNHQSLVLFDDIWTTGSTVKEAAKVLKRSGISTVWGLTVARAV